MDATAAAAPGPSGSAPRLRVDELLDDVANSINDYVNDGFDAFDNCVLESLTLSQEQAQAVLKGSVALHSRLTRRLDAHVAAFERAARAGPLSLPTLAMSPPTPNASSATYSSSNSVATEKQERDADAELEDARTALRQARTAAARARRELAALASELRAAGPALAPLAAVPGAASVRGKENAAADATALAAGAAKLAALLPRADAAAAAVAAAAAAREGGGGSFGSGGGGGGGFVVATAAAVEADVERARRAAGGTSTSDLRRLRELVAPPSSARDAV